MKADLTLIDKFLSKFFPNIESVLLFGSYIENGDTANDIDLILIHEKFPLISKESFVFQSKKFNVIKLCPYEIFHILGKDINDEFYYKIFLRGVILNDKNLIIFFIRNFLLHTYKVEKKQIFAKSIQDVVEKIENNLDQISQETPVLEFQLIAFDVIRYVMGFILNKNQELHLDGLKYKARFFNKYFPKEEENLMEICRLITQNDKLKFLKDIKRFLKENHFPFDRKYSNDYILDDYTQPELILYLNNPFKFNEIVEFMDTIGAKFPALKFYLYQVDELNLEAEGCYIIFDNNNLLSDKDLLQLTKFINEYFKDIEYTFPYNNLFYIPEIAFAGKENAISVQNTFYKITDWIRRNDFSKEEFILTILTKYMQQSAITLKELYHYFLLKLNRKTHTSNYLHSTVKILENKMSNSNKKAESQLVKIFSHCEIKNDFDIESIKDVPHLIHYVVIDKILSIFLSRDVEKLLYTQCLSQIKC